MADNTILLFRCLNPECGQLIKLHRPAKTGVYPVTCPYCKTLKKLNLKGLDAFGDQKPADPVPDNSANPAIDLKRDFLVGETYKFQCPHCESQEIGLKSEKTGHKEFACPRCKGKIIADVRGKTHIVDLGTSSLQLIKGKLVLLRKGWLNKDYPLGVGRHTVGRYDESEISDISVKNDNSMSRRSVRIDVDQTPKGYMFKLTVLKATNPVLHNNVPLSQGESVSLNFGDSIILGRTRFRFDRDK